MLKSHIQMEDAVASACLRRYRSLPKRGKPQKGKEWTVLAGIVVERRVATADSSAPPALSVVALATGSKCEGASDICTTGEQLLDSHAEVIARRSLVRYLLEEIRRTVELAANGSDDPRALFEMAPTGSAEPPMRLREGVKFHMYVSQAPCGDACIFEMDGCTANERAEHGRDNVGCAAPEGSKRKRQEGDDGDDDAALSSAKRPKSESEEQPADAAKVHVRQPPRPTSYEQGDIHRTGARCVPGGPQDSREPLAAFHTIGVLRTKPGRGIATNSMSCSDKIARWTVVGLQGALLASLVGPIYLDSLVVGRHYNSSALVRAIVGRVDVAALRLPEGYARRVPLVGHTSLVFESDRESVEDEARTAAGAGAKAPRMVGASSSLAWWEGMPEQEATARGRKQGVTCGGAGWPPKARSLLCKVSMASLFRETIAAVGEKGAAPAMSGYADASTYAALKGRSSDYVAACASLTADGGPFRGWVGNRALGVDSFAA